MAVRMDSIDYIALIDRLAGRQQTIFAAGDKNSKPLAKLVESNVNN
jgi:hypothetical protein